MVSRQCQQVWGFYIGIWEGTCVNLCAFQFNECHSSMVLWIEMTPFTKLSNRSTRLCYLIFQRTYWLIFFICSCWVNIPKDLTKKIANVCVKLVEENNEIIKCLCRNLPLYLKKNKKNKWRRNILFLCSFVIHTLRTHHMLYTVHKQWN